MMNLKKRVIFLSLFFWGAAGLVISIHRSLWGDEWNHVQDLKQGLVWAALELLKKPSPFAPGEAVLNGVAKFLLAPLGIPTEVWARVQGLGWALATLYAAFFIFYKAPPRPGPWSQAPRSFMPLLVAFSAALISLATEMRPYASLFFSGALSFMILCGPPKEPHTRFEKLSFWAMLFFGHLYGLCFVTFACFLKRQFKDWPRYLAVGFYLLFIFSQIHIKPPTTQATWSIPPLEDVLRQIFGTLGNPHKASYAMLPLALMGFVRLAKQDRKLSLNLLVMTLVMVGGPLIATIAGHYFFVPRQVVGGSFIFLFFVDQGLIHILDFAAYQSATAPRAFSLMVMAAVFCMTVLPWSLSTILAIPPFPNQPFHRFREIAHSVIKRGSHGVLSLDVCNLGPIEDYFTIAMGSESVKKDYPMVGQMKLYRSCWVDGFCFQSLLDMKYCYSSAADFSAGGPGANLIRDGLQKGLFDTLIHSWVDMPGLLTIKKNSGEALGPLDVVVLRDW